MPIPTNLDLQAWDACLQEIGGRPQLRDFLHFGFPVGYVGPISDSMHVENHPSALDYPSQVQAFLDKEIGMGGGGSILLPTIRSVVPRLTPHVSS